MLPGYNSCSRIYTYRQQNIRLYQSMVSTTEFQQSSRRLQDPSNKQESPNICWHVRSPLEIANARMVY
ncbi:uncharacterized protein CANTADRAFT_231722 [Suhomyces tanzawaensis NRRL Y-17324]|uniref:Uncharacterized protein n=1 Tax=Suhomyces tanzawaensis NRRL Y-17324 TaxID=984487 RepID=A0A1E4SLB6_9ASCO|nr:uncharacterized protein CANTADRAFT_231722 [Suhomyces tanzawaensis NRRL Y-17324]ODV80296.1 hypothetical protein CANTADRAFT_231722 [Suhomyces tanzawaensis NRRL Y-17324]